MENKELEKSKEKLPLTQILAVIVCNIASINNGLAIGWLSPALPQMFAEGGSLNQLEPSVAATLSSWLAGAFPLGALACTPCIAIVSEKFGRKVALMLSGTPFAINGIIVLASSDAYLFLVGRFLMGMGMAMANSNIQVFTAETADPKIRGGLGSCMTFFFTIGVTLAYIVGGFISYVACGGLMLLSGLTLIILFIWIPETPVWLSKNGKIKRAIESIAWYRQKSVDDPTVTKELEKLREEIEKERPSIFQGVKLLVSSKPIRRGFLICTLAIFLQGWMGMSAVHSFSVTIFMESGSASITPEGAAVIYGVIQMTGAFSSLLIVDKLGRKLLMAVSTFGISLCMLTMGLYFQLKSEDVDLKSYQWVSVLALCLCVYMHCIGAGNIPFILLADLLVNEVRSAANTIIMFLYNINLFLVLLLFAPALNAFGAHPIFYFFCATAGLSFILTLFVIPETKGKTTEEIQAYLAK